MATERKARREVLVNDKFYQYLGELKLKYKIFHTSEMEFEQEFVGIPYDSCTMLMVRLQDLAEVELTLFMKVCRGK